MDLATLLSNETNNENTALAAVAAGAAAQANVLKYKALVTLIQGVQTLRDSTIAQVNAQLTQTKSSANAQLNAPAFVGPAGSATLVEARLTAKTIKDADLTNIVNTTKMAAPLDTTKTVVDYRNNKSTNDADLAAKKLDASQKRAAAVTARGLVDVQVAVLVDKVGSWAARLSAAAALVGDVNAKLLGADIGGAWAAMIRAETELTALAGLSAPDTTALTSACDAWATAEDAAITADSLYQDAISRQVTDAANLAAAEAQAAAAVSAYVKSKS